MKISGTSSSITFNLGNGYILRAKGELLLNKTFVVYKDSMKHWEPPYDDVLLTPEEIESIINEVNVLENKETLHLEFL